MKQVVTHIASIEALSSEDLKEVTLCRKDENNLHVCIYVLIKINK